MDRRVFSVTVSLILVIIVACTLGIGYVHEWNTEYMAVTASVIAAMATVIYSAFVYLQIESSNKTIEIMSNQLTREIKPILINEVKSETDDYTFKLYKKDEKDSYSYNLAAELLVSNIGRSEAINIINRVSLEFSSLETYAENHIMYRKSVFDTLDFLMPGSSREIKYSFDVSSMLDTTKPLPDKFNVFLNLTQYYSDMLGNWYKTITLFDFIIMPKELSEFIFVDVKRTPNKITFISVGEVVDYLEHEYEENDDETAKRMLMVIDSRSYMKVLDNRLMKARDNLNAVAGLAIDEKESEMVDIPLTFLKRL